MLVASSCYRYERIGQDDFFYVSAHANRSTETLRGKPSSKPVSFLHSLKQIIGSDFTASCRALEPAISGTIMETHHSKHHQTYINGLNAALEKYAEVSLPPLSPRDSEA